MVPHLTTALTGPLLELERQFLDNSCDIEKWFRTQWQDHMPPFYGSTDLRNSGFKLAPVDLNLFPGGFNNLNDAFMPLCVQAAQAAIERICPDASKLLLIPENHTRNQFYLQNVAKLVSILRLTGLDVRIGSLLPEIAEPTVLELANGATLTLEPLRRSGSRLGLDNFDPCAVLLNNDLSAGIPQVLKGLDEQWLIPPLHAGWHKRRKSKHAECYDRVAREFASASGASHSLSSGPPLASTPSSACAARSTSRSAPARSAWPARSIRCSPASAPSTRSTASPTSPSWWSRPMPAPMAWA